MSIKKEKVIRFIFSAATISGVIATGVLAGKATIKAKQILDETYSEDLENVEPKEQIATVWKCYIPAMSAAALTISLVIGNNILSHKQQASLIAAYSLMTQQASAHQTKYKEAVKKVFGDDADEKIEQSIMVEHTENTHISAVGNFASTSLNAENDENTMLFYDSYSERYFESSLSRVIEAQYHLNRNFLLRGCCPLDEFYEFLGLEHIGNDKLGWEVDDELYWIDFNNQMTTMDDGLECCIISMATEPWVSDSVYC